MLKPSPIAVTPTTQELAHHWANRYRTDLQQLSNHTDLLTLEKYVTAAYPENRSQTLERVARSLNIYCELGAVNTVSLFSISSNVVNLNEARRLAIFVEQVYQEILALYAEQPSPLTLNTPLPVEQMAEIVESRLLELQEQHQIARDPRTIGFLTTQFHFSTQVILRTCTPYERLWLRPYFQFIEEQVGIPWQRLCAAAEDHDVESPLYRIVSALLPLSKTIAKRVYRQGLEQYPTHHSRRGRLDNPQIVASTLRDLEMFQGYFLLCLLVGNMDAIAAELLPLCQLVFPSLEVGWDLVESMVQRLVEELHAAIAVEQQEFIQPFTASLLILFSRPDPVAVVEEFEELDDLGDLEQLADGDILELISSSAVEDLAVL
jgi:Phycobilisome protein